MHRAAEVESILRLNEWRVWADRRLLGAARTLDDGQLDRRFGLGQGTVRATLTHLQATEEVWLARTSRGENLRLSDLPAERRLDELAEVWDLSDAGWRSFLEGLTPGLLGREVSGTTIAGQAFRIPMRDSLLHVFTHASYTFAQANNMLRQLGAEPVDVMLSSKSREENPLE